MHRGDRLGIQNKLTEFVCLSHTFTMRTARVDSVSKVLAFCWLMFHWPTHCQRHDRHQLFATKIVDRSPISGCTPHARKPLCKRWGSHGFMSEAAGRALPTSLRVRDGARRVQEVVELLGEQHAASQRRQLLDAHLRQVRQARARAHECAVVGLRHALYSDPRNSVHTGFCPL